MNGIWGVVGSIIALIGVFGTNLFKVYRDSSKIKKIDEKTNRLDPIKNDTQNIYAQTNDMCPKVDNLHNKIDTINKIENSLENFSGISTDVRNIVTYIEIQKELRKNSSFTQADQVQAAISAVYEKNSRLEMRLREAYEKNKELEMQVTQLITQNQFYEQEIASLREEIHIINSDKFDLTPQKNITKNKDILR